MVTCTFADAEPPSQVTVKVSPWVLIAPESTSVPEGCVEEKPFVPVTVTSVQSDVVQVSAECAPADTRVGFAEIVAVGVMTVMVVFATAPLQETE